MTGVRVRRIEDLGRGAWRVAQSLPLRAQQKRKPRSGATPHARLWLAVKERWPEHARLEFPGAVPGRRYRIDIAFPEERLAIEVDGWEWHGKHKGDFARDRERQNLLTLHGWRILRFTAGEIRNCLPRCVEIIARALAACRATPHQGTRNEHGATRSSAAICRNSCD